VTKHLLVGLIGIAGCPASPAPAFSLTCHSASTASSRQVHCIRTDTRSGEVKRLDLEKLAASNGPSAAGEGPAGRYQTACAAAESDDRADFYCVQLDTDTGELTMLNLGRVSTFP
jgi:hypothetical protein